MAVENTAGDHQFVPAAFHRGFSESELDLDIGWRVSNVSSEVFHKPSMADDVKKSYRRCASACNLSQIVSKSWQKRSLSSANIAQYNSAFVQRYDVHMERLPAHSPYVGTFHRGYQHGGSHRTYDFNREKLAPHCPYVGNFHRGYSAAKRTSPRMKAYGAMTAAGSSGKIPSLDLGEQAVKEYAGTHNVAVSHAHRADSQCSGASTPPLLSLFSILDSVEDFDDEEAMGVTLPERFNMPTVPQSPELCGLQAILPRQSGVRVLDKIGEGSFAKVVLAMNHRNRQLWQEQQEKKPTTRKLALVPNEGDRIVLKCIKKDYTHGSESLACIQREVKIHSGVSHPNIPVFFGHYEDEVHVTLLLGFVEGRELNCAIKEQHKFSETETKVIGLQILNAITYLHSKNVVHRDVTPRNILVASTGLATLIDLGLAVDLNDCDCVPQSGGTMGYIAPETYKDEPLALGIDIFSMGCIMYEMIFSCSPFMSYELLSPMPVEFPDPMYGVDSSEELQSLLVKMLEKDTSKRITAAEAVKCSFFSQEAVQAVASIVKSSEPDRNSGELVVLDGNSSSGSTEVDMLPELACCLTVDGPGHKSDNHDSNYFVYARVVSVPEDSDCWHAADIAVE